MDRGRPAEGPQLTGGRLAHRAELKSQPPASKTRTPQARRIHFTPVVSFCHASQRRTHVLENPAAPITAQ